MRKSIGKTRLWRKISLALLALSAVMISCYLILLQKNFLEADVFGNPAIYTIVLSSAVRLLTSFREEKKPKVTIRIPLYKLSNIINTVAARLLKNEKIEMFWKRVKTLKPTVTVSMFKFKNEYVILVNTDKDLAKHMSRLEKVVKKHAGEAKDLRSVVIVKKINGRFDGDLNILIVDGEEKYEELVEENLKTIFLGEKNLIELFRNTSEEALRSQCLILYGDEILNRLVESSHTKQDNSNLIKT